MSAKHDTDLGRFYIPARWDFKNATNRELLQIREEANPTVLREIVIEMEMRGMLKPGRQGAGYPEISYHERKYHARDYLWNRIEHVAHVGTGRTRDEARKSLGWT